MRIVICILIFYRKLILPSLAVAIALAYLGYSGTGRFSWGTVGIGYILITLIFQYFIYEIRNPNDYYFYHNIGLSKYLLWGTTLILSLLIVTILMIGYVICR
jgi:hypothetical protein